MLCLAAGPAVAPLLATALTLAWTHSVEKIAWEEDWRESPAGLVLVEARIRGSGAGMEPPPEARLEGGVWRWQPGVPAMEEVVLRRSGATADWRLCMEGVCRPMEAYLPADADPVVLSVCADRR